MEIYPKLKDSPDANVREHAQALAVIFGGSGALDEMRKKLADANAPLEARRQALNALVAQRDAASLDALLALVEQPGPLSMMPEGLLTPLHEPDVRDLFLYLRQKQQVPMLVTAVNANDFFNGSDLHNWIADTGRTHTEAWRAESGEIIGTGGAPVPVALTSEMVAGEYKLTAQIRIRGEKAAAEIVLCGEHDASGFHGITLSFGGPSAIALLDYRAAADAAITAGSRALGDDQWHTLEVVRKDKRLTVNVDGKVEFDIEDPHHRRRVSPSFHLLGKGAELRVKAVRIEAIN